MIDIVVKLGGGLLAHQQYFDAAIRVLDVASTKRRLLIVPGGGPFADTVRSVDSRLRLPQTTAHWMAVLAMDQYAHLVAARLSDGAIVRSPEEIAAAIDSGRAPVLAPSHWLGVVDPLPHSWIVTSDSIAAWVAGAVGAPRLVLIKPPRAAGSDLVDGYFERAVPKSIAVSVVTADQIDVMSSTLSGG